MILKTLRLENWRAHDELELSFERGLNVVLGRNEAGKSSLVEALDFALYRDITGATGRLKTEEIRAIIPAHEPNSRPKVVAEIEFSNCRATFTKILAEDSGKRECTLILRRENLADEHFERVEAQAKWKELLCADGVGNERGTGSEGALLVSHQGESIDFLTDGGAALRATIGVAQSGEITLTRRLERVRNETERARKKELLLDYTPRAIDAARGGSEAATERENLKTALEERQKFSAYAGEIEELRDEIEITLEKLREIEPLEKAASEKIVELGAILTQQTEADKRLAGAKLAAREAGAARELERQKVENLARLQSEQERAARELETHSQSVTEKIALLEAAQKACDASCETLDLRNREWETARDVFGAWRAVWDVYEAQTRLGEQKRALETLQNLGVALQEAEAALKTVSRAPSTEEIASWRAAWNRVQELQKEGESNLQIELEARAELAGRFKADASEIGHLQLSRGQKHEMSAVSRGVLEIAGVGVFKIKTGARGALELKAELEAANQQLKTLLADWKVEVGACPGAFEVWENRRREWDAAHQNREERARELKNEEARVGSLHQAQKRVEEAQSELDAAKKIALPLEELIPFRGLSRSQVRAELDLAHVLEKEAASLLGRARNESNTLGQKLKQAEVALRDAQNKPEQIRAGMETRALEIEKLQNDGLGDDERRARFDELGAAFLRAEIAREEAEAARHELGQGVSQWKTEEARRAQLELAQKRADLEKELVRLRTDLRHFCDQDPRARLEELEAKIEILEPEVARHESRLRGLALLDGALQAERLKLSRDLAGPINEKLGPYLSKLRGKETVLEFDSGGTKIESVRTGDGQNTISLPFSQHSEGMKEQVAFALRLILAQKVAQNLPSKILPLVLDDPFTQSDAARKLGLSEVLREALPNLQMIFVSCHAAPTDIEAHTLFLGEWFEDEKPVTEKPATEKPVAEKPVTEKLASKRKKAPKSPVIEEKSAPLERELALF